MADVPAPLQQPGQRQPVPPAAPPLAQRPDPNAPKKIPQSMTRMIEAVRSVIEGVSEAWMGPNQPLAPLAADTKGRIWDYPVAFNLNQRPRANMAISFQLLQNLADNCGVLRSVIETRKDQVEALEWSVRMRKVDNKTVKVQPNDQARIDYVTKLFMNPNKDDDWSQFLRKILEQHFVYDAVSVERVRNRGGALCALKPIDGATISVLLDPDGGTPASPQPAYQQVLKGLAASNFSTDELLYYPRNRRIGQPYGYPHVAQIIHYIDLALKRVKEQISAYEDANAPIGFIEGAPTMTIDQISAMQSYWDSIFNGNQKQRSKTWWVPSGSKYTELKRDILFDEFDEWLARVICYCFSIAPTPFIKANNRATAQTSSSDSTSEGLGPTKQYIKRMMDYVIRKDLNSGDLEFTWDSALDTDPVKQATVDDLGVKSGILSIDEVREDRGMDALGGAFATPMVLTATGYVPVDPHERLQQAQDFAPAPPGGALPPGHTMGPDGKPIGPDGKPSDPALLAAHAATQGPPGAGGGGFPPKGLPGAPGGPQKALGGPPGMKALPAPGAKPMAPPAVKGPPVKLPPFMRKFDEGEGGPFEISRLVVNHVELRKWATELGFTPPAIMKVAFVVATPPQYGDLPFVQLDTEPYLEKADDGVRLIFAHPALSDRAEKIDALDPVISILVNPLAPIGALPLAKFDGKVLLGPEEIVDLGKQWDAAAFEADHQPSRAQAAAGNYKMGHLQFQGLDISIENPAGSARKGKGWQTLMPTHYGYIKGTIGADGDHVDCFVGPDEHSDLVWVIDQHHEGSFDEHKVLLGYSSWSAAKHAYMLSYSDNKPERIGAHHKLTIAEFKHWLENGDTTQPLAKDVTVGTGLNAYDQGVGLSKPPGWQAVYNKLRMQGGTHDEASAAAWSQTGHMAKRIQDVWADL